MARPGDLAVAWTLANAAMAGLALWVVRRAARERGLLKEERMLGEEMEAYAGLDPSLTLHESPRALAKRVCATVAQHSAFRQVAMLLRDAESRLHVVGSAGVDDLMAQAINARVARFARERRHGVPPAQRRKSCPVTLEPMEALDPERGMHRRGRQVMILPLWSHAGEMLGALAVWKPAELKATASERELAPLETLALKLARSIDLTRMSERLLQSEKMAGLGNLAKGLAHELNNPLTAVLGFAELIAETATDPRVRGDAAAIAGEAMRMKETIDALFEFWRPSMPLDKAVDVAAMLRRLTERLEPELTQRGVRLVLHLNDDGDVCNVRGDERRLTEVFEHLLNNAAQAVTAYKGETARSVRLMLHCEQEKLRVVVSDTGAGFADAARVFDPFYTTRQPGDGQGLGLAVSYGIVRDHGGEISAFNVHPHGAAVVVELPLARVIAESANQVGVRA